MSTKRSCLLDLSRFRTSAHGHVEFGGLNRVIMVRKLEERTFNAKNGQEIVTRETIETFRGNEKTDRKITRLLKPNALARRPFNLSTTLSEDAPLEEENFEQEFLRVINKLRNKHGAPNLHISDRLRISSQALADSIAAGKSIEDAIKETDEQNLGINIYWFKAGANVTPTSAIAHWYSEGKHYMPNRAENCDPEQFRSSSEYDNSQSEHETSEICKTNGFGKSNRERSTSQKRDFVNGAFKANDTYESDASTSHTKLNKKEFSHADCTNFTQMLWKSSLQIGVSQSCDTIGRTVIVAVFQPKGNLTGQYYKNLPRSESLESFDSNASSDFSKSHNVDHSFHSNENFSEECLRTHNKFRALHGAPPLRLSKRLCKYSQQWANTLAIRGRLEHRPHSEFGENLYCSWDLNGDPSPAKAVSRDLYNHSWSHSEINSEFSGTSRSSFRAKQASAPKTRSDSRLSNGTPTSPAGTTFLTTSRTTSSCSENLPSLCSGKMSPCVGFKSASVNGKSKFSPNAKKSSTRSIPERPVTAPPKTGSKIARRSTSSVFPQRSNTVPRPSAFERHQIRTASLCSGSVPEKLHTLPSGREAVERWYAEVGQHEFYKEPITLRTGHFTQVVWNDSRELGVGVATNKQGQTFIVANYYPPGNFLGSFSHNVPPLGGFRTMLSDEEDEKMCNGKNISMNGKMNGINKTSNESSGDSDERQHGLQSSTKHRKKLFDRYKIKEDNDKNIARINGIINNKLHEIYEWDEFVLQGLKVHNEYRKKHGVPNLILSQELCEAAREWSQKLSRLNKFKHRPGCEFGENIFVVWSSDVNDHVSARDVIRCWYEEGREYDWDAKEKARGGAQFTQIIWRATKELGMAVSSNGRGKIYVVANYRPRGNVIGQFSENVNKPL